jgi:hypothetical protein
LSLSACQARGETSPEDAAAQQLIHMNQPDVVIDANSFEFLQNQEFDGRVYVLFTYNRNWGGRNQQCLAVSDTYQKAFQGWYAENSVASCPERDLEGVQQVGPVDTFGGTFFRPGPPKADNAFAAGRVNHPETVRVQVAWVDGQTQVVEVTQGAFLAVRAGEATLKAAVGLDKAGVAVNGER